MEADTTQRKVKAMYVLTWFNWNWEQVAGCQHLHTAHEMWECLERWNVENQRNARDDEFDITDVDCPMLVSVEVRFVEV